MQKRKLTKAIHMARMVFKYVRIETVPPDYTDADLYAYIQEINQSPVSMKEFASKGFRLEYVDIPTKFKKPAVMLVKTMITNETLSCKTSWKFFFPIKHGCRSLDHVESQLSDLIFQQVRRERMKRMVKILVNKRFRQSYFSQSKYFALLTGKRGGFPSLFCWRKNIDNYGLMHIVS